MSLSNFLGGSHPLPPEKTAELKQIIHDHLRKIDLQATLRETLEETLLAEGVGEDGRQNGDPEIIDENRLMAAIREKGIMDKIMRDLGFDSYVDPPVPPLATDIAPPLPPNPPTRVFDAEEPSSLLPRKTRVDPAKRHLFLQFLGGRAFIDYISLMSSDTSAPNYPGASNNSSTLTLHAHYRGQRFRSRPAICACEPDLKEGFLLELHNEALGAAARMATPPTLMAMAEPIHLVLIKTTPSGDRSLVASHRLEWRTALSAPNSRKNIAIELMGVGSESKVPVGVLEAKLEIIPAVEELNEDVVIAQLASEKAKTTEKERLFLSYAKQWWREFLNIRPEHSQRLVKIFAQDETGANRPVCSYVKPLRCGRLLDSPRHAARFVSLLSYEKIQPFGGSFVEQWYTTFALLTRARGDVEPHACLLCSLLLGFGLDAYVVMGTRVRETRPHAWVLTRSGSEATFWESLTGQTSVHSPATLGDLASMETSAKLSTTHRYATVGCVFNHETFYANIQPLSEVGVCRFDFADESRWKMLSPGAIASVCALSPETATPPCMERIPPLTAPNLDPTILANDLEIQLRSLIAEHRQNLGLLTAWDDRLAYMLHPALAAYELDKIMGPGASAKVNEDFQQAIRNSIPEGHTFKGFPLLVLHRNAGRIMSTSLRSSDFDDVVSCRGDHVALAVRVHVTLHPENVLSAWIMFACRYKLLL